MTQDLIRLDSALGQFFQDSLQRGEALCFAGYPKVGKTSVLIDLSCRALQQGNRVAYFCVGDMGEDWLKEKIFVRLCEHPHFSEGPSLTLDLPKTLFWEGDSIQLETEEEVYEKSLDSEKVIETMRTLQKGSGDNLFKIFCCPGLSMKVSRVEEVLSDWRRQGWTPDVVVIDNPDNLAPLSWKEGVVERTGEIWRALSRVSKELDCLLLLSSQIYEPLESSSVFSRGHLERDIFKLSHVSGMVGLNQTPKEKGSGVMRLNWIYHRREGFSSTKLIYVAGNLALCNPFMVSLF